jgi:hypothetical protein
MASILVENGSAVQTWAPHVGVTAAVNTTTAATLVADAHYTIVSTVDFWWAWGAGATASDAGSGYWPANIPLFLHTGANTSFGYCKNSGAGYITFYRNA